MLIKSFEQSCPPRELIPPTWDLTLVPSILTRAPCEPLCQALDRHLTLKTVFLLALASSKRVGELHGLSYGVKHARGWMSIGFEYVQEFGLRLKILQFKMKGSPPFLSLCWAIMLTTIQTNCFPGESRPLNRHHDRDVSPYSPKGAKDRSASPHPGCSMWHSCVCPSKHSHAELHHSPHKCSSSSSGSPYEHPECLPDHLPVVERLSWTPERPPQASSAPTKRANCPPNFH